MRPLRILFVEASTGGVVGGSLTGLYHLIRGLDRSRFVSSMVLYENKAIEPDLEASGVTVYRIARRRMTKKHALLDIEGYRRAKQIGVVARALGLGRQAMRLAVEEGPAATALARVVRRERPSVLHLGNGLRANFDGLLAARLTDTPVVCHVKGFEKYSARERWAARSVDAIVSMTHAVRTHCLEHGVKARLNQVVYDALDAGRFQPTRPAAEVRAELGLESESLCIGIVGNVQEWKGQAVVVEAMAGVQRHVPGVHCFIIGGAHRAGVDYERRLRRRVAELGLDGTVHFTGFRADVPDIMNALDIVVHASIRPEPFGRVILEGMLLGRPVVAAAAGGVPELIEEGKTGFLVSPGNIPALTERLVTLLRDADARRTVGQRAQQWVRERFSLSQQVAAMTEIYHGVVRAH